MPSEFALKNAQEEEFTLEHPDNVGAIRIKSNEIATKLELAAKVALAQFTGANQRLAGNGYQKLPGGLIIQWGCITGVNNASNVTINFPIAFPTSCVSVTGNIKTTSTDTSRPLSLLKIYNYSATSLVVRAESIYVGNLEFPYIAIGY